MLPRPQVPPATNEVSNKGSNQQVTLYGQLSLIRKPLELPLTVHLEEVTALKRVWLQTN